MGVCEATCEAFLVDCLFDHNCEKVSVAARVGKCVDAGLRRWGREGRGRDGGGGGGRRGYLRALVRLKGGKISIDGRRQRAASRQRSGA